MGFITFAGKTMTIAKREERNGNKVSWGCTLCMQVASLYWQGAGDGTEMRSVFSTAVTKLKETQIGVRTGDGVGH